MGGVLGGRLHDGLLHHPLLALKAMLCAFAGLLALIEWNIATTPPPSQYYLVVDLVANEPASFSNHWIAFEQVLGVTGMVVGIGLCLAMVFGGFLK